MEKNEDKFSLKEILDKNYYSNQNNEFKSFILPKNINEEIISFESQMDSIISALSEDIDLDDAIYQAKCLEDFLDKKKDVNKSENSKNDSSNKTAENSKTTENSKSENSNKITEKDIEEMIKEAIELSFRSSHILLSEDFQKKLNSLIKDKNYSAAFEEFKYTKKDEYIPDNEFIKYLCLGLINMDDIKDLKIPDINDLKIPDNN